MSETFTLTMDHYEAACRDKLWQRGPGPKSIDEDGTAKFREGEK